MIKLHRMHTWPITQPKFHLFAGGETHVSFEPYDVKNYTIWVEAHIGSMVDMGYLLSTLDAIYRVGPRCLGLYIPYFPGARQDHPEPGTPGTLAIYVDMLKRYNLSKIVVADPHSPVLQALMPCEAITPAKILAPQPNGPKIFEYNGIIAPDAGAEKRARDVAAVLGKLPVYTARKVREQSTGHITSFEIEDLPMGRYLLVDDICDGGATFNILATSVRKNNKFGPGPVLDLYVTHGIFSKGFTELLNNFEKIITTDSFTLIGERPRALQIIPITHLAEDIMNQDLK